MFVNSSFMFQGRVDAIVNAILNKYKTLWTDLCASGVSFSYFGIFILWAIFFDPARVVDIFSVKLRLFWLFFSFQQIYPFRSFYYIN